MSTYEGNGGSLPFRMGQIERQMDRLSEWRSDVDKQRATQSEQLNNLQVAMNDLTREVRGYRRTLMTFAVSIAGSSLVFGLSILAATGKI